MFFVQVLGVNKQSSRIVAAYIYGMMDTQIESWEYVVATLHYTHATHARVS